MAELTQRHGLLTVLRAPVSGWGWRATVHLVVGFPFAVASFVATLTIVILAGVLSLTVVLAPVGAALLTWVTRGFTMVQRSRLHRVLGVAIPGLPGEPAGRGWFGSARARLGNPATWRQVVYHLLALVIGTVGFVVVTVVWSFGAALAAVLTYAHRLPDEHGLLGWNLRSPGMLTGLTILGVAVLLAAPWLAGSLADIDASAARALLGPSRTQELTRRVDTLTESREGVVGAANDERRRIERDLHDGTQQRLVSLAMNLGMARTALADAPDPARRAVEEAHEEAKHALSELRGFIRGLHPAVLDDRGLDAALSGIAARAPLPVHVTVNLTRRCSPTVEAIAYFVVSEALTNVARHAQATRARVVVDEAGVGIRVTVADDGVGGADPARGSGLRGLRQRVASVDGALTVVSPEGGPTVITAELPCEP